MKPAGASGSSAKVREHRLAALYVQNYFRYIVTGDPKRNALTVDLERLLLRNPAERPPPTLTPPIPTSAASQRTAASSSSITAGTTPPSRPGTPSPTTRACSGRWATQKSIPSPASIWLLASSTAPAVQVPAPSDNSESQLPKVQSSDSSMRSKIGSRKTLPRQTSSPRSTRPGKRRQKGRHDQAALPISESGEVQRLWRSQRCRQFRLRRSLIELRLPQRIDIPNFQNLFAYPCVTQRIIARPTSSSVLTLVRRHGPHHRKQPAQRLIRRRQIPLPRHSPHKSRPKVILRAKTAPSQSVLRPPLHPRPHQPPLLRRVRPHARHIDVNTISGFTLATVSAKCSVVSYVIRV